MKKILSLAVALFSAMGLMASVNTLNYQAVINTPEGKPASEKEIGMRFSIVNGDNILISEETVVKSSAEGLVEWQVGSTLSGGLSAIDWSVSGLMLQVGIDLNGGSDYSSVYSSTIQSVPVAMYAERSGDTNELRLSIDELHAVLLGNIEGLRSFVEYLEDRSNENSVRIDDLSKESSNLMASMMDLRDKTEHLMYELDNQRAETDDRFNAVYNGLSHLMDTVSDLQKQVDDLRENK
ncbi:MAG: hypothetical protein HDS38_04665 [Bacteroides sp.]|nr:hypothetical protein [Bacteroides sp.]